MRFVLQRICNTVNGYRKQGALCEIPGTTGLLLADVRKATPVRRPSHSHPAALTARDGGAALLPELHSSEPRVG